MNTPQTFSILIWANPAKADTQGLLPLYARVTVDGRRAEISLKKKVSPKKWDAKAGLVKGNSEEARTVNSYLNQVKNQLFKLYHQMQQNEAFITADAIKVQFNGPRDNRKTLLEVFRFHNQQLEKLVGIDVSRATLTKFNTIYKKVESFIRHHYQKPDVYLEELTHAFVTNLEFYLKTEEGLDHNTAMRYIRSARKIITLAVTNGWLTTNPFQHFRCTLRKVERNILTAEELQCLANKNFGIARLEEVRDIFLFCCYTGLAFIDVQKLSQTHIVIGMDREKWLQLNRTKTNVRSNVPLLPQALSILEKYQHHPTVQVAGKLLPVKSNQKMNAYLKEVADVCGIRKKLTMHIARHTFATTVTLANGVPMETVSSMLGHTNLRTTQVYAKVVEKKVSEDMQVLRRKLTAQSSHIQDQAIHE